MTNPTPDPAISPDSEPTPDSGSREKDTTDLEELNPEGLGATIGEKDTFEPEESEAVE